MIDRRDLELYLELDSSFADTSILNGVMAKISSDGLRIVPLSSATDVPDGIIHDPQDRDVFGQPHATLVLLGAPYQVRFSLGATPSGVTVKTKLALNSDGTLKKAANTAGEVVVGEALEVVASTNPNQRVKGRMYAVAQIKA